MTGKQALLEMLKAEGVEYIFGNPGTSEGPIIDMLGDYPEFKYILALQESVAVGMGEAYARATRRASFVSLHVDSGLANGIALMLDAYNTGTPMVVTSANYDVRKINEVKTDLAELVRRQWIFLVFAWYFNIFRLICIMLSVMMPLGVSKGTRTWQNLN